MTLPRSASAGDIAEHMAEHRRSGRGQLGDHGRAIEHEYLQRALVQMIAANMKTDQETRRSKPDPLPADLLARHAASTIILVLNWWIERQNLLSPSQVDSLFHSLVVPAL